MRQDDRQLGKPLRAFRDTKTNVEALSLGASDEGCTAYATDTDRLGTFNGAAWTWVNPSGNVQMPIAFFWMRC